MYCWNTALSGNWDSKTHYLKGRLKIVPFSIPLLMKNWCGQSPAHELFSVAHSTEYLTYRHKQVKRKSARKQRVSINLFTERSRLNDVRHITLLTERFFLYDVISKNI